MNKEQIREIFLRNGFTIKEGQTDLKDYVYQAANELLAAQLEKAPEPVAWIERRFANGEMVLEVVKDQKMPDNERANLLLHYDLEIVPLFTSPPEVAELQKQVQDLIAQSTDYLERLRDVRGHYEAANKATEHAHVALAESQHKVIDLEKQMQTLQAENKELQNVADLARFLANTWEAIDRFVYANIDVDAIDKYPVIQGTSNQINLAKIGTQKYSNANLYLAIAYLLKDKS